MTDEHYDLDFHRAMQAAYKRQLSLQSVEVYKEDYVRFTKLCNRYGYTMAEMFRNLLANA